MATISRLLAIVAAFALSKERSLYVALVRMSSSSSCVSKRYLSSLVLSDLVLCVFFATFALAIGSPGFGYVDLQESLLVRRKSCGQKQKEDKRAKTGKHNHQGYSTATSFCRGTSS